MPPEKSKELTAFLQKETVTILVADSGLGGMSICADIARSLPRRRHFAEVSLVYFNAWPEQDRGYNRLENTTEQIQVFDKTLTGMMRFDPDIILIACNTLSVLYPRTNFSRHASIPVIDIVEFGVDAMTQALHNKENDQVVILGTLTTIDSNVHRDRLLKNGIPEHQIVLQSCDQLATAIEKGPDSHLVSEMIQTFMREAATKIDPFSDHLYGALCCTHFAYSHDRFRETLTALTGKSVVIINPNHHMTDYLLSGCRDRLKETHVSINVVSKIIWEQEKTKSIADRIRLVSADTADALTGYTHKADLFN
jgi:glutamate racemase